MSNQTVQADHDELQDVQQQFNSQAHAIESMNKALQSRIDTLRGGDWIGQGANKFFEEMDSQVMPALHRLQRALVEGARAAQKTSSVLRAAEDEASQLWKV